MAVRNDILNDSTGTDFGGENPASTDMNDTVDALFNEVETKRLTLPPIGSIIAYDKDNTNADGIIPDGWLSCDGSVVDDEDSPLDGITLPLLNGTTDDDKRFLKGSSDNTSGTLVGSSTHSHTTTRNSAGNTSTTTTNVSLSTGSSIPPYYEILWIIRIK